MNDKNEIFERMPIAKAYFKLSLPVVFSMVISLVYNMVDTYFIAKTDNTDLVAGVAIGAPVFTLMIAIGDIFGLGGSSVISRLFGRQMDADGKRLSVFCFYGALLTGAAAAVLLLVLRRPVLTLLGAEAHTYAYASDYYTWIALGSPFIIVSFTPANQLRTEGHSNASMVGSVIGAAINIILDPIFISALGYGAAGAAAATVVGYICTDLFYLWFLMKRSKRLSVDPKLLSIQPREVWNILAIGIPASITNIAQSFCVLLTNRYLVPYGTDKVAAMGIAMKVSMIAVLVMIGFAFGVQPLIGYNYGAQNIPRLRKTLRFSYIFECSMSLGLTILLWFAAPVLIRLFMNDPAIIASGTPMLRRLILGLVCYAFTLVTTCTFQAAGKALGAFILSISGQGIIYALVMVTASRIFGYMGVITTQPVADMITCMLAIVLFFTVIYKELKKGGLKSDRQNERQIS